MTRRHIHYESAFEDLLRSQGVPYVAVDEAKKPIFAGAKIKCFDFLVYGNAGAKWLTDVKGRRFPYETVSGRRYWENWVTGEDLASLPCWQDAFGDGFQAAFVFAYWLDGPERSWPGGGIHPYRGRYYAFLAVPLSEYQAQCRRRSPRWDTYFVAPAVFRRIAQPVETWWRDRDRSASSSLPAAGAAYNEDGTVVERLPGKG